MGGEQVGCTFSYTVIEVQEVFFVNYICSLIEINLTNILWVYKMLILICVRARARACTCASACARIRVCARARASLCVRARVCVCACVRARAACE